MDNSAENDVKLEVILWHGRSIFDLSTMNAHIQFEFKTIYPANLLTKNNHIKFQPKITYRTDIISQIENMIKIIETGQTEQTYYLCLDHYNDVLIKLIIEVTENTIGFFITHNDEDISSIHNLLITPSLKKQIIMGLRTIISFL